MYVVSLMLVSSLPPPYYRNSPSFLMTRVSRKFRPVIGQSSAWSKDGHMAQEKLFRTLPRFYCFLGNAMLFSLVIEPLRCDSLGGSGKNKTKALREAGVSCRAKARA